MDYTKYVSKRPISTDTRAKITYWNARGIKYGDGDAFVDDVGPTQSTGVTDFWPWVYLHHSPWALSPELVCDIGKVDLSLDEVRDAEKSGSWLRDYFLPYYDKKRHELPESVIGELIFQVTDAAAKNGATYTEEALGAFVWALENIKEHEEEILGELLFGDVLAECPKEYMTLEHEDGAHDSCEESAHLFVKLHSRNSVLDILRRKDRDKAKEISMMAIRRYMKDRNTESFQAVTILRAGRVSRRASHPVARAAASSSSDDSGGSEPPQGDPDLPSRPLTGGYPLVFPSQPDRILPSWRPARPGLMSHALLRGWSR